MVCNSTLEILMSISKFWKEAVGWQLGGGHQQQHTTMGLKRPYYPPRQTIFPGLNSVVSTNVTAGPGGATPVTGSTFNAYNSNIVRFP